MKFRIIVRRDSETIKQVFDNIESKGIVGKVQKKVFQKVYDKSSKSIFNMVKGLRFKGDVIENSKNKFVVQVDGTKGFVEEQEEKLKRFLDGKEEQIKDIEEVKKWKRNRTINKILSKLKRAGKWLKDKSLKKALKDRTVRSFFLSAGVTFGYEIISD